MTISLFPFERVRDSVLAGSSMLDASSIILILTSSEVIGGRSAFSKEIVNSSDSSVYFLAFEEKYSLSLHSPLNRVAFLWQAVHGKFAGGLF